MPGAARLASLAWLPSPPALDLSQPAEGLSIGLAGPSRVAADKLGTTPFEVRVRNAEAWERAFVRRGIRLVFYDARGRRLTRLEDYFAGVEQPRPGLYDLVILRSGEVFVKSETPLALPSELTPGIYTVEAWLISPAASGWSDSEIEAILRQHNIPLWSGPEVISPRYRIELE